MSALYCRNDGRVYSYCTMFFENCNSIVYFCCISSGRLNGLSEPALLPVTKSRNTAMLAYTKRAYNGKITLLRLHLADEISCL